MEAVMERFLKGTRDQPANTVVSPANTHPGRAKVTRFWGVCLWPTGLEEGGVFVRKTNLRTVRPGESGQQSKAVALSVAAAAASGTHRELLLAMRDRIAKAVSDADCPPRDLASLTRRLQDIAKEIELLDRAARDDESIGDEESTGCDSFDVSTI